MAAALGALLGLAWLGGFIWFVNDVAEMGSGPGQADGIVVLTGGADRIATGMRLLQGGQGRVLLISGVGTGANLPTLLRAAGTNAAGLASRITLGREATSTAGNADETAGWVAAQGLHSLLVVTASYHMQRALTELQRSLPDVRLSPVPVLPPALRRGGRLARLGLLAHEYTKLIVSTLGLARMPGEVTGTDPACVPG